MDKKNSEALDEMWASFEKAKPSSKSNQADKKKAKKKAFNSVDSEQTSFSAYQLYNFNQKEVPKLLEPFFQKVGLAALVGTSDSGKSTFLRQLALSVCLQKDEFLDFKLNVVHNKALYVSTEDDYSSISYAVRKQVNYLKKQMDDLDLKLLKNLEFIFDTDDLLENISTKLKNDKYDLIVIDAFGDVFSKEINANTQVRNFLRGFDVLAKKHECLIIFLHHIGKRTDKANPSKDSIIGSQAFEAKMRAVVELRPNKNNNSWRDLWVLKANFLNNSYKKKSFVLEFNEHLSFENTGNRGTGSASKSRDPEVINKVMELHEQGLTVREISGKLKETPYATSKSTVSIILKENK